MKVPKSGGAAITLASGQGSIRGLAVDATHVYWTNARTAEGLVMKVALDGGTPVMIASQQATPNSVAVDATSVYWTNGVPIGPGPGW